MNIFSCRFLNCTKTFSQSEFMSLSGHLLTHVRESTEKSRKNPKFYENLIFHSVPKDQQVTFISDTWCSEYVFQLYVFKSSTWLVYFLLDFIIKFFYIDPFFYGSKFRSHDYEIEEKRQERLDPVSMLVLIDHTLLYTLHLYRSLLVDMRSKFITPRYWNLFGYASQSRYSN